MEAEFSKITRKVCKKISTLGTFGGQYELTWKCLDNQRKDGLFCDVVIQCRGSKWYAHKCILASLSPYFKALFTSPLVPQQILQVVNFDYYSEESTAILLDMIYHQLDITTMDIEEILALAEFIQCDWVVEMLVKEIRLLINPDNVFFWYSIARNCGIKRLTTLTDCYIRTNFPNLVSFLINDLESKQRYTKEVVLYQNDTNELVYKIDIEMNTFERYNGPCSISNTHKITKGTFFVHGKDLFVVCDHLDLDFRIFTIHKYDYCLQKYNIMQSFILKAVIPGLVNHERFYIYDVKSDHQNSLYMLFTSDTQALVLKYNLIKMNFSNFFIELYHDTSYSYAFVECKNTGTLLIKGLEDVFNIGKFMFDDIRNQSMEKLEVFPYIQSNSDNLSEQPLKTLDVISYTVSVNGEIYLFTKLEDEFGFIILKFDADQCTWVHLYTYPLFVMAINPFCCQGELFILCVDCCYCADELDKLPETCCDCGEGYAFNFIYHFNPEKMVMRKTTIQVPEHDVSWLMTFKGYNIPAHVLLL